MVVRRCGNIVAVEPMIKYFLGYMAKFVVCMADCLVPKDPSLWLFYITPKTVWDANMQCIFALAREDNTLRCFICHHYPKSIPDLPQVPCLKLFSVAGLWHCFRAGVILFDHAVVPGISKRRRQCINLWHGVPIKRIRFFCPQNFPFGYLAQQRRATSWLIASSAVDRLAMIAGFQVQPQQVWTTGLPRNDLLTSIEPFVEALPYLKDEQKRLRQLLQGRKLILYAPTYRDPKTKEEKKSGSADASSQHYFSEILRKHNAVLGLREHVYSSTSDFSVMEEHGVIVHLSAEEFTNTNLLLQAVDVLITDYSSIWVDFLLLERPVIGYCPDFTSYAVEWGFIYDFKEVFPGPLVETLQEVAQKIDQVCTGSWTVPDKQKIICRMFHKYRDGKNSERVLRGILHGHGG